MIADHLLSVHPLLAPDLLVVERPWGRRSPTRTQRRRTLPGLAIGSMQMWTCQMPRSSAICDRLWLGRELEIRREASDLAL